MVLHNKGLTSITGRLTSLENQTLDFVHVEERLMCACTDRQGGAGLDYACAHDARGGGDESVTFDLKFGVRR